MRLKRKIFRQIFVKYSQNTPANGQSEQNIITDLCFVYLRNFFREGGWLLEERRIKQILLKKLDAFQGVTV